MGYLVVNRLPRDPTPEELEHLKAEFMRLFPDAAASLRILDKFRGLIETLSRTTPEINIQLDGSQASCQWMGFKSGYMLAREEASS